MSKIKIIIDNKIPFIQNVFEPYADVQYLSPSAIIRETVAGADALIVRTRTKCNDALLSGSSVRFIGTATIGTDHIDIPYCESRAITWTNAPGCNAESVAQYVASVLAAIGMQDKMDIRKLTVGLIGVGHVGSKVAHMCKALGMRVLLNDPPRQQREGDAGFVSLQTIQQECDVISLHTPLTYEGLCPSFHLADNLFFSNLKKCKVFINGARGEVVDTVALNRALDAGKIKDAIIDCWEGEPNINLSLLECASIATPHIAGYSADGKANATRAMIEAVARFFELPLSPCISIPEPANAIIDLSGISDYRLERALLSTYDPVMDSRNLKSSPADFEKLRGNYGLRRESSAYTVQGYKDDEKIIFKELGFCLE